MSSVTVGSVKVMASCGHVTLKFKQASRLFSIPLDWVEPLIAALEGDELTEAWQVDYDHGGDFQHLGLSVIPGDQNYAVFQTVVAGQRKHLAALGRLEAALLAKALRNSR